MLDMREPLVLVKRELLEFDKREPRVLDKREPQESDRPERQVLDKREPQVPDKQERRVLPSDDYRTGCRMPRTTDSECRTGYRIRSRCPHSSFGWRSRT